MKSLCLFLREEDVLTLCQETKTYNAYYQDGKVVFTDMDEVDNYYGHSLFQEVVVDVMSLEDVFSLLEYLFELYTDLREVQAPKGTPPVFAEEILEEETALEWSYIWETFYDAMLEDAIDRAEEHFWHEAFKGHV